MIDVIFLYCLMSAAKMTIMRFICIMEIILVVFAGVTDGNTWTGDEDGGDKEGISTDHQVDVKPGEDALLPCRAPGDENIRVAEWQRVDLNTSPADILVIRDGEKLPDQHPSVDDRVELKDPDMKNRDVSVVLKNVSINDTGTYKCHVKTDGTIGNQPELVNIIKLRVKDSGQTGHSEGDGTEHEAPKNEGRNHLITVLTIFGILVGFAFGVVLCYHVLFVAFWEIARRSAAALNSWRSFLFKLW